MGVGISAQVAGVGTAQVQVRSVLGYAIVPKAGSLHLWCLINFCSFNFKSSAVVFRFSMLWNTGGWLR